MVIQWSEEAVSNGWLALQVLVIVTPESGSPCLSNTFCTT
jgi:hypothetical protein